jgi:hypothetical protein
MTEEESDKSLEKINELSTTIKRLEGKLETQKKEFKEKRRKTLLWAVQLLLYHLRKRKHLKKRQKRGYIPVRWYQKVNIFEKVSSVSAIIFGGITVYLLFNQNDMITSQTKRIDQQTYLQEAERRSTLVFLMGNIFDEVSNELKVEANKDKKLSPQLVGRIIAISHSLIPYKSLMGGELSKKEYSAERGQLLITLVNSGINENTLREIYEKSNFKHSYLFDMDLSDAYLYGIDLSGSMMRFANLQGANLQYATLKNVNLIEVNLDGVKLNYSTIYKTELYNAKLDNTDFTFASLDTVWVNKRVNINESVFDKNIICSTFYGNNIKDTVLTFCIKK